MEATLEEAYEAACIELGSALVQQRLLAREVQRLTKQVRDLTPDAPELDGRNG